MARSSATPAQTLDYTTLHASPQTEKLTHPNLRLLAGFAKLNADLLITPISQFKSQPRIHMQFKSSKFSNILEFEIYLFIRPAVLYLYEIIIYYTTTC